MNNCITLKNLDLCKNTILYFLALQIPGNRQNVLNHHCKALISFRQQVQLLKI